VAIEQPARVAQSVVMGEAKPVSASLFIGVRLRSDEQPFEQRRIK